MNIVIKAEEIYKDLQRKAVVGESNILRSETNTFPERIALEVGYYRITPLQVKRTVNNFLPNYSYDEKMEFYNFLYSNKELSYLEIEALGSKFFSNQPNFANLIPKLPLIQLNCLLNSITDTIDDTYYFVNDPEFLDKLNDEDEKEQACHTHLIQQDLLNNIRDLQNINKVIQQEIARLGN